MLIAAEAAKMRRIPSLALATAMACAPLAAAAATETILHKFTGSTDGHIPSGPLAVDASGNLYGTTVQGGAGNLGSVYIITSAGKESVRYSFGEGGIQSPLGGVALFNGDIFGTTSGLYGNFDGSVFRLGANHGAKQIHIFGLKRSDGFYDNTGLAIDQAGNLYGTTAFGGSGSDYGIVYKISPKGRETVLYRFQGGTDGQAPSGTPILDAAGNLYGVTQFGGTGGAGTVYKITPGGTKTSLYDFSGPDGDYPIGALTRDAAGNLYGATLTGGANGQGALFEVTPSGAETTLYSFTGYADGGNPIGPLVLDAAGNLYGTATAGGAGQVGTVYELSPQGNFQVLYAFKGGTGKSNDGAYPNGGLLIDASGALYGTTQNGGGSENDGTVFKVTP